MSTNSVATLQNTETNKANSLDVNSVASIIPYSKGFIVACGKGKAFLYEKNDEKEYLDNNHSPQPVNGSNFICSIRKIVHTF